MKLTFTPEEIEELRRALKPTPEELDMLATLIAEKLRATPQVWTIREFAARMGKSYSWAYELVRKGQLKAIRPNGTGGRLITAEAVQDWLAATKGAR